MQPYGAYPAPPPPPPQKSNVGLIIGIVLGVVAVIGIVVVVFAILAVSGTRKYIQNAKTAEAKNSLGQIAKDAAAAYEQERIDETAATTPPKRELCKSAAHPVPAEIMQVRGVKYQSARADWTTDAKDAGWTCLRFEMYMPQYYQYDYRATASSFTAYGRGDLNGDGKSSEFKLEGKVQNEHVVVAPTILERDPEE